MGQVVLLCEHASNRIPARYGGLGLAARDRDSHAAWDPGARDVCLHLSRSLDAPVIASRVSRLVYDCNRPPDSPGAMTPRSELIDIPGNVALDDTRRAERIASVYEPFCAAVDAVLDVRAAQGLPTALVTIHSFTPIYFGARREVEIGILHDADTRLADAMLAQDLPHRRVMRNMPYGPEDGVTHSLILHGLRRGLPNVMIELRNDLLSDDEGVETLSTEVLLMLRHALADVMPKATNDA
jgi:predicted N-formylglutamate amidohydrolase